MEDFDGCCDFDNVGCVNKPALLKHYLKDLVRCFYNEITDNMTISYENLCDQLGLKVTTVVTQDQIAVVLNTMKQKINEFVSEFYKYLMKATDFPTNKSISPWLRTSFRSVLKSEKREKIVVMPENTLSQPRSKAMGIEASLFKSIPSVNALSIPSSLFHLLTLIKYIPSKWPRFGIKLFLLCDAVSGYIHNLQVYITKKKKEHSMPVKTSLKTLS